MRTAWWLLRERSRLEGEQAKPRARSARPEARAKPARSSRPPRATSPAAGESPRRSGAEPPVRDD